MRTCGLYYLGVPNRKAFALDGVHVSARVVGLVCEVQVVQFYVNHETVPVDAEYIFPLDSNAAVCGFEAELPDKLLLGEVRERQEAKREYNAAVARGETAALLEQEKGDVFKQKIGNIPPLARVNIRITYVAECKVEADGSVRFVLPTAVAPRYSPSGTPGTETWIPFHRPWHHCCGRRVWFDDGYRWRRVPYWDLPFYRCRYVPNVYTQRMNPCAFSLNVECEMASEITSLTCGTHEVKWQYDDEGNKKCASASLWNDTEALGKDFVLKIHQHEAHEPRVQVEVSADGSAAAMLTMVPDFDLDPEPVEIVLVVDCSGSMGGTRMNAAGRALKVFLQSLPQSCYFNIVKFGSRYTSLFSNGSQAYTEETMNRGMMLANSISANLGGTEILQPLKEIFGRKVAGGRARQVFVLTDGEVSNTEAVIQCCRENAHNSRVFTIGIGNQVSRALVDGMARAGDGTSEYIVGDELSGTSAALEMKIINQLKIATQPAISKVMVDWGALGDVQAPPQYEELAKGLTASTTGAPSKPTGEQTLVTFVIECSDTIPGEEIHLVGSCATLGKWDPSKAVKLVTHDGEFPRWTGSASVPEGEDVEFKFLKSRDDGFSQWESIEDNRTLNAHGLEAKAVCGTFNTCTTTQLTVTSNRPVPPPEPTPTTAAPSITPSNTVGSGPQRTGPSQKPVSKFFKTGPAAGSGASRSPHAVGSGPISASLAATGGSAPRVGYGNDASAHQAHGRNSELYQAPFLPPPIFSGSKFVFYAFFAAGKVPIDKVTLTAQGPEGPIELDIPVTKLETVGRTVHVLAAKTLIKDLESAQSHLHYRYTPVPASERGRARGVFGFFRRAVGGAGQDKASAWSLEPVTPPAFEVKREMVELGVKYGLVSAETSFVAVERWLDGRPGDVESVPDAPMEAAPDLEHGAPNPGRGGKTFFDSANWSMSGGPGRGGGGGGTRMGRGGGMDRSRKKSAMPARGGGPMPPPPSMGYGALPSPSMSMSESAAYGHIPLGMPSSNSSSNEYGSLPPTFGGPPPPAGGGGYGSIPSAPQRRQQRAQDYSSGGGDRSGDLSDDFLSVSKDKKEKPKSPRFFAKFKKSAKSGKESAVKESLSPSLSDCDDEEEEKEVCAPSPVVVPMSHGSVNDLLACQAFNGSFALDVKLARALGKSLPSLEGAMAADKLAPLSDRAVWGTVLALAAFAKFHDDMGDMWSMVAEKAKTWLVAELKKKGVDRKAARAKVDEWIALATTTL